MTETRRNICPLKGNQPARANYGSGGTRSVASASEDFLWDGLALIKRGDERFVNEPHVGGGNPVASSKGTTYFNDILGTTVGIWEGRAPSRPKSPRYSAAALTAFGESLSDSSIAVPSTFNVQPATFFTGKPEVAGLGHAFLFRNYRASLAKWQTADPLGYPDGWNQLAYCGNGALGHVDFLGTVRIVCYDKNGMSAVPVSRSWELRAASRDDLGSEGGHFGLDSYDIVRDVTTGEWQFNFYLDLSVSSLARHESEFLPGEVVRYREHDGYTGDSVITPYLYEAILAHEYGHANEFFMLFLPDLILRLESNFIDDIHDVGQANSKFSQIYAFTDYLHIRQSGDYADASTWQWFRSSPSWQLIRSQGLEQTWKKVE